MQHSIPFIPRKYLLGRIDEAHVCHKGTMQILQVISARGILPTDRAAFIASAQDYLLATTESTETSVKHLKYAFSPQNSAAIAGTYRELRRLVIDKISIDRPLLEAGYAKVFEEQGVPFDEVYAITVELFGAENVLPSGLVKVDVINNIYEIYVDEMTVSAANARLEARGAKTPGKVDTSVDDDKSDKSSGGGKVTMKKVLSEVRSHKKSSAADLKTLMVGQTDQTARLLDLLDLQASQVDIKDAVKEAEVATLAAVVGSTKITMDHARTLAYAQLDAILANGETIKTAITTSAGVTNDKVVASTRILAGQNAEMSGKVDDLAAGVEAIAVVVSPRKTRSSAARADVLIGFVPKSIVGFEDKKEKAPVKKAAVVDGASTSVAKRKALFENVNKEN